MDKNGSKLYTNKSVFLSNSELYAGLMVAAYIETHQIEDKKRINFFNNIRNFYIELASQIYRRLPFENDAKSCRQFKCIQPKHLKNIRTYAVAAAYFISNLDLCLNDLNTELRSLKNNSSIDFTEKNILVFW